MRFNSNEEYLAAVHSLLEEWRAGGQLGALEKVLPAYSGFNGLTDGWTDLRDALADAKSEDLPEHDHAMLRDLVETADNALARRG